MINPFNRVGVLIQDLHSYYFVHYMRIPELETYNMYIQYINQSSNIKIYHDKLLQMHSHVVGGISHSVAISSVFTKNELDYFCYRDGFSVEKALEDLESLISYDKPFNYLFAIKFSIDHAYKMVEQGDISRYDFVRALDKLKINEKIETITDIVTNLSEKTNSEKYFDEIERVKNAPKIPPINTPCEGINQILNSLQYPSFNVIAAKTNVGKTAFATYIAYYALKNQKVLYLSLEMSEIQTLNRIFAIDKKISIKSVNNLIKGGCETEYLSDNGEMRYKRMNQSSMVEGGVLDGLFVTELLINRSVENVINKIQRSIKNGVTLIIIDYLQNIAPLAGENGSTLAVTSLCTQLQAMTVLHGVTVMGCSQMNRSGAHNERPTLTNLKASSAVETAADAVIMMHRFVGTNLKDEPPIYTFKEKESVRDLYLQHMLLTIEKNRHGPNKVEVELGFMGRFNKFFDLAGLGLEKVRQCFSKNSGGGADDDIDDDFTSNLTQGLRDTQQITY